MWVWNFWSWKILLLCDVDSWKFFVVTISAMWEFTCCVWTRRKLFVGYLGHVGIFCAWLGKKKFGSCVWTCEKFWLWWNFGWGIDLLLWWSIDPFGCMIFGCEQFLVIWVLVVGIFFDMWFWSWENFLDMWSFVVGNFCWTYNFGHGKFFLDMWLWSWKWWVQLLCCRASRVEVVLKCWKIRGKNCLLISKASSMKRTLVLSSKLC